ncbi:hypothetical protein GCM10027217_19070 [Pseudomaricurvus hydrocarbonicus]
MQSNVLEEFDETETDRGPNFRDKAEGKACKLGSLWEIERSYGYRISLIKCSGRSSPDLSNEECSY